MSEHGAARRPATTGSAVHVALGLAGQATSTLAELLRVGADAPDDGPAVPPEGSLDPVDVAVGLAFRAGDLAGRAAAVGVRTTGGLVTMAQGMASLPGLDLVGRRLRHGLEELATRGAAERATADDAAGRTVEAAIQRTTTDLVPAATDRLLEGTLQDLLAKILPVAIEGLSEDPALLIGVVDAVLPEILPDVLDRLARDPDALLPLVDAIVVPVLPDVLGRLERDPEGITSLVDALLPRILPAALDRIAADPDALVGLVNGLLPDLLDAVLPVALEQLGRDPTVVRELVLDQSGGMATEMANTVRARAVAGDEVLDRIGRRLLRRPRRPAVEGPDQVGALPPAPRDREAGP